MGASTGRVPRVPRTFRLQDKKWWPRKKGHVLVPRGSLLPASAYFERPGLNFRDSHHDYGRFLLARDLEDHGRNLADFNLEPPRDREDLPILRYPRISAGQVRSLRGILGNRATLLPNGPTVHSQFKILLDADDSSGCGVNGSRLWVVLLRNVMR